MERKYYSLMQPWFIGSPAPGETVWNVFRMLSPFGFYSACWFSQEKIVKTSSAGKVICMPNFAERSGFKAEPPKNLFGCYLDLSQSLMRYQSNSIFQ